MKLRSWLGFLLYCGFTVVLTYPLILNMGSVLPNDAGDPALNTWILWWNTQAVPFTHEWWSAPAFYPAPGVLTFSENLLVSAFSPHRFTGLPWTSSRLQRRVLPHVSIERDRRLLLAYN